MGLESPLKAEGPVGGCFCLSWMDGWVGGATIIVAGESRDMQYVFVQFVQGVEGFIVASPSGNCICAICKMSFKWIDFYYPHF